MPIDILKADFHFPRRVYVVGSGLSARENARLIPPDAFIIACNRAIELPIKATIWLCHDVNLQKNAWFNDRMGAISTALKKLDIKNIRAGGNTVPVFSTELQRIFPVVRVVFQSCGDLYKTLDPAPDYLSPAATVTGQAIQLAFILGSKEIILVGCDMRGGYFTGEKAYPGDWPCKAEFDWLVNYLRTEHRIDIQRIEDMHVTDPEQITMDSEANPICNPPADLGPVKSLTVFWTADGIKVKPVVSRGSKSDITPLSDATGLPSIGYLCMTFDPIDMMNAVHDFMCQDWPIDRKKLYLLRQRNGAGQFPPRIVNNLGLQIVEIDVDFYPWPEMWTGKFMAYLEACDCEYTLWFDEDDRYPPDYTRLAILPILAGLAELSWSWDCIIAEHDVGTGTFQFRDDWYRSPVGQMVIKTDLLREYRDRIWRRLYEGDFHSPKRIAGVPYGGAQDDQLRQMIQRDIPDIPHHRAKRVYFVTSLANSAQLRARGNALDYRGKRGTAEEAEVQPTRFDFPRSG